MSDLSRELRVALDDPKRYEWGEGPWEHLGDAERDVRRLLDELDAAERQLRETREALAEAESIIRRFHEACWEHDGDLPDEIEAAASAALAFLGDSFRLAVSPADTTEGAE